MKTYNPYRRVQSLSRAVLLALGLLSAIYPGRSHAATFTVNGYTDGSDLNAGDGTCAGSSGACTLRAAIEETNALSGADTITVPSGVYKLQLGELQVTDSLTINVSGAAAAIIDAGFRSRVLAVLSPGALVASGLRIQHGRHNGCGAGVYNQGGATLTLTNSIITGNRVQLDDGFHVYGGGFCNEGSATLTAMTVRRNSVRADGQWGSGGGIANGASDWSGSQTYPSLTLYDTRIDHNYVYGQSNDSIAEAGGLHNEGSIVGSNLTVVHNAALSGAEAEGGGILDYAKAPGMTIDGLTVSYNRAISRTGSAEGGGISLWGETANLTNVVITANRVLGIGAPPRGGGLDIEVSSSFTLAGGLVSRNVVSVTSYASSLDIQPPGGAGIVIDSAGATVTLSDVAITFNRAIGLGATDGGLWAVSPATLNNVVVSGNIP